jgi:hypothetical protein
VFKQAKIFHALDRAATAIGWLFYTSDQFTNEFVEVVLVIAVFIVTFGETENTINRRIIVIQSSQKETCRALSFASVCAAAYVIAFPQRFILLKLQYCSHQHYGLNACHMNMKT